MSTEKVIHDGEVFALIIYSGKVDEGVQFYTEDEQPLQVGKHCYVGGKIIKPHRHVPVDIELNGPLQEVLYIESGKVEVTFYSCEGEKIDKKILARGDTILLMNGGHGFEFLENTKMLEVKQGPFIPESKKSLEA